MEQNPALLLLSLHAEQGVRVAVLGNPLSISPHVYLVSGLPLRIRQAGLHNYVLEQFPLLESSCCETNTHYDVGML